MRLLLIESTTLVAVALTAVVTALAVLIQQVSSDVAFSTAEIAIIGALLGPLVGALVYVHKSLIAEIKADRDEWRELAQRGAHTLERGVDTAATMVERGARR